jgi:hypothetical protein
MKENKVTEIPQKIYKLYLEQRRLFEASQKMEELTKVSMELSEIEYVNPYLSRISMKSTISGEYYGS